MRDRSALFTRNSLHRHAADPPWLLVPSPQEQRSPITRDDGTKAAVQAWHSQRPKRSAATEDWRSTPRDRLRVNVDKRQQNGDESNESEHFDHDDIASCMLLILGELAPIQTDITQTESSKSSRGPPPSDRVAVESPPPLTSLSTRHNRDHAIITGSTAATSSPPPVSATTHHYHLPIETTAHSRSAESPSRRASKSRQVSPTRRHSQPPPSNSAAE